MIKNIFFLTITALVQMGLGQEKKGRFRPGNETALYGGEEQKKNKTLH